MANIFSFLLVLAGISSAQAFIPGATVTSYIVNIYGSYSSSDATCKSGFIPLIPLSSTPTAYDFKTNPTLASGTSMASPVNCVVVVMQNKVTISTNSTYTSTSFGYSDSVCNNKTAFSTISTGSGVAQSWPASGSRIYTDMTAAGIAMPTTTAGTTSEALIVYFSSNSACTGNPNLGTSDPSVCYTPTYVVGSKPPVTTNDTSFGYKLPLLPDSSRYREVINPDMSFGGNGTSCASEYAPSVTFVAY